MYNIWGSCERETENGGSRAPGAVFGVFSTINPQESASPL